MISPLCWAGYGSGTETRRLSPDQRQPLKLRQDGREWADIVRALNGNARALRK
jgi:hypothetical protein